VQSQGVDSLASSIVIVYEGTEWLDTTVELLRQEFFSVPVAGHSDSRQAAALVARARPAVLICDANMPRVGGVALITLAQKRWGQLPIIVLVDNSGLGAGGHIRVSSDMIYLEKPFPIGTLCECIMGLLSSLPHAPPSPLEAGAGQDAEPQDEERASLETVRSPLPVLPDLTVDRSLSAETPLPAPSRGTFGGAGDTWGVDETMDLLDEEIELIDPHDGPQSPDSNSNEQKEELAMALTTSNIKENLAKLESIDGFIGAALADSDSGMCMGYLGGSGTFSLEVAAASNTDVVRSKRKAMKALNLRDEIEDILISLGKQYHLIRPVRSRPNLFYYLVVDRQRANLAMARHALGETERELPM
jgi:CheY-like chemotaxis protein